MSSCQGVRNMTVEAFRNPRKSATVRAYLVLLTTLATFQQLDHVRTRHRGANTRRIELEGLKGDLVYPCLSVFICGPKYAFFGPAAKVKNHMGRG